MSLMTSLRHSLVQVQLGRVLKYGGAVKLSQVVESISHVVNSVVVAALSPPRLTRIPTFYEKLLPPPLLSNDRVTSSRSLFSQLPEGKITPANYSVLLCEVEVHPYLATSLYHACYGPQKAGSCSQFLSFLQTNSRQLLHVSEEVRTFHVLAGCSRDFLVPGDFQLLIETFMMRHPRMSHLLEYEDDHGCPRLVDRIFSLNITNTEGLVSFCILGLCHLPPGPHRHMIPLRPGVLVPGPGRRR